MVEYPEDYPELRSFLEHSRWPQVIRKLISDTNEIKQAKLLKGQFFINNLRFWTEDELVEYLKENPLKSHWKD